MRIPESCRDSINNHIKHMEETNSDLFLRFLTKEKPLKTEAVFFPRERLIIRHDKLTPETRGYIFNSMYSVTFRCLYN